MKRTFLINTIVPAVILFSLLLNLPVIGQGNFSDSQSKPYIPITKVDLGVKSLNLSVGETYTFNISYEPEDPFFHTLLWFISNDSVISVDPGTNEVTALTPGNARILAETLDGRSYTVCDVTVSGTVGKDASEMRFGSDLVLISSSDRSKISARSVKRYMEFFENTLFNPSSYETARNHSFTVTAHVTPGTEITESERAHTLGMAKSEPLTELNLVNLIGTIEQILAFTSDNPDLIEIFELEDTFLSGAEGVSGEDNSNQKAMNLKGSTETLTSVSTAHNLGLNGDGVAIAIIDTGLNSNHEQFAGRVSNQHCFSTSGMLSTYARYESACTDGAAEANSARPNENVRVPKWFDSGSHTAGAAAGRDGIAPKAKIVAIQAGTQQIWWCGNDDERDTYFWQYEDGKPMCYDVVFRFQDMLSSYNWLLKIQQSYKASSKPNITAVSIRDRNSKYANACDYISSDDGYTENDTFQKLLSAGIIPVVSTGDNSYGGYINSPACKTKAFSVGALDNSMSPRIANYSNHSELVDILAPGTQIYSAVYSKETSSTTCSTGGTNCYGYRNSTSAAAGMVTGAFALLRQANPQISYQNLETLLKTISTKNVNKRYNGTTFSYTKPVLDFSGLKAPTSIILKNTKGEDVTNKSNITVTNKSVRITATVLPSTAPQAVTWKSSDTSVATVTPLGYVVFSKYGTVQITATTTTGKPISAWVKLSYKPATTSIIIYDTGNTNITGKTISTSAVNYQLKAVGSPLNSVNVFTWKTDDSTIATVNSSGKVTFKRAGTVTITAAAADDSGKSAWVKLTFVPPLATSVKIKNSSGTDITGKTVSISSADIQLNAAALPTGALQKFMWSCSDTSVASISAYGKVTFKKAGTVTITAKVMDGSEKSAWVKLEYTSAVPELEIKDSNIRGKNKEIQIVIPWDAGLTKVECTLYNDNTNKQVSMSYKERMNSTGKNKIISYVGSPLENGTVYRFRVRVSNGKWSNYVEKYAMPIANVYGATVVAGNKTMVINNQWRENTSGTRYMLCDAATEKEIAYKVGTKNNTTWTYSALENSKLYFVIAVPYRDYKGQRLWGPNQMRIYFMPMTVPSNGTVTFLNNSQAQVSIDSDTSTDGIRVLYRVVGGSLMNGCESNGKRCEVSGLNRNNSYEFYVMKYKTVNGKNYYSMGILVPYKASGSGLKAPQNNPVVTMTNSGYTTFSIKKAAEAEGISVLYREGEDVFRQACEKAGNSCSTKLSTSQNYTFYIMQWRTVNGKKAYSPGIVARDFSSGKSADTERIYTKFYPADDVFSQEEIRDAIDGYLSEDDILASEAMAVIAEDMFSGTAAKSTEEFIIDPDDHFLTESLEREMNNGRASEPVTSLSKEPEVHSMPEQESAPFTPFSFFLVEDYPQSRDVPPRSFENR